VANLPRLQVSSSGEGSSLSQNENQERIQRNHLWTPRVFEGLNGATTEEYNLRNTKDLWEKTQNTGLSRIPGSSAGRTRNRKLVNLLLMTYLFLLIRRGKCLNRSEETKIVR